MNTALPVCSPSAGVAIDSVVLGRFQPVSAANSNSSSRMVNATDSVTRWLDTAVLWHRRWVVAVRFRRELTATFAVTVPGWLVGRCRAERGVVFALLIGTFQ